MRINETVSSEFVTNATSRVEERNAEYVDIVSLACKTTPFVSIYSARKGERLFILKALAEPHRNDSVYVEILRKEYEVGVRMDHPGICRMIAFEQLKEIGYAIVMEYVNGMNLRDYIKNGSLNERLFKTVVKEQLEAVEYIHKCGYAHKDLKPENILISAGGSHVKIIDFGFLHGACYRNRIVNGGTRKYLPPASAEGKVGQGQEDLYAIGMIILEMLDGLTEKTDKRYAQMASALLCRYPDQRFLSVSDLIAFLTPPERQRNAPLMITMMCTVMIVMGLIIFLFFSLGRIQTFPGATNPFRPRSPIFKLFITSVINLPIRLLRRKLPV